MKRKCDRQIILEDGSKYSGYGFGDIQDKILEIVFNTSMVGYQEILSDPSYTDQAVVMTYPLIGNYGMADEDYETDQPSIGALIVHEYNDEPSNFRSTASLGYVMRTDHRHLDASRRGPAKAARISDACECSIPCQQQSHLALPRSVPRFFPCRPHRLRHEEKYPPLPEPARL